MYRGNYGKLIVSTLCYIIKHSSVWVMPIVIANVINSVTGQIGNTSEVILQNAIIISILILLNIPMNYLHVHFRSSTFRSVETLSSQMFVSLLNIIINIIVALAVTAYKNKVVFIFFLLTVPVAVVPQDSIIFSGSIRENITYVMKHISEKVLEKVIEAANLRELIDLKGEFYKMKVIQS